MTTKNHVPTEHLFRKRRPEFVEVTPSSIALFRLGEQCNNTCPMCSNSGRKEAFFIPEEELLRRIDWLEMQGIRRVVVTGGEPTIHPGFWSVIDRLRERKIAWDINTHGRTFHDSEFSERARSAGLERAIVSLHSQDIATSCRISGIKEYAHRETIDGIKNLSHVGVFVLINLVITRFNHASLSAFVDYCASEFGTGIEIKMAFPSTSGKGGEWEGIQLTYSEVGPELRAARARARAHGIKVHAESVPPCIIGDSQARNLSRSGFGETHYLEDIGGRTLYSIRHIEASFNAYPPSCRSCSAIRRCPGVSTTYLERYGANELVPFGSESQEPLA